MIEFLNDILQNDGRLFLIHRDSMESKEQQEEKGGASGTVASEPIVAATEDEENAS